jgi:hypothetical protein
MIPPYSMPSGIGNICPRAFAISFGHLTDGGNPVIDRQGFLSVVDFLLDTSRLTAAIEFRVVATETLLGIVGLTALEAFSHD